MDKSAIIKRVKESNGNKVRLAITDIDGILRGKVVHKDKFFKLLDETLGFCNVVYGWDCNDECYENTKFTGWHTGYPDAKVAIDTDTIREIPWENGTCFVLGDFFNGIEEEMAVCPRTLLRKIEKKCQEHGFIPWAAQEFEWYNFKNKLGKIRDMKSISDLTPITTGMFGYSILKPSMYPEYINAVFENLDRFNVPLEGMHTETGPGVYEAALKPDRLLFAADKATLFKTAVKEIAYHYDVLASFMAKWNNDLPGCGGHIHQSLWDIDFKHNLFYEENSESNISQLAKHYIAGQLKCLPEIMPMYAPNVNSYKRLTKGTWAPTSATWGIENRTTSIRFISKGQSSTRVEMRVPGADTNPYLAMAASIASGLYGITNKLPLETKATIGNGYEDTTANQLPSNLLEASLKMEQSKTAKELFGEAFVDHFVRTRKWEWDRFEKKVTDWELNRYLEII